MGVLHTLAGDKTKTLSKVRFWTEQLKRAVQIRYGALGNDLEQVRRAMQHSKTVLRNQQGLESVQFRFI